jgi:hypothetical protein
VGKRVRGGGGCVCAVRPHGSRTVHVDYIVCSCDTVYCGVFVASISEQVPAQCFQPLACHLFCPLLDLVCVPE